ncbi:hypothetical protein BHM03_00031361 [Ensete ventricosum]|uniref:Protein kinase domain-containing protein n=1 Tax=Ensete ventricosum TaxID=4639 RepID=A0A445MIP6_ENSVE|nr:hypothetical protein BHM03_00031361 [Ensete ventricosum]
MLPTTYSAKISCIGAAVVQGSPLVGLPLSRPREEERERKTAFIPCTMQRPLLLLLSAALLFSCAAGPASAAGVASDAAALLAFKAKADPSNRLAFFPAANGSSSDHCRWPGVGCSGDGRVVRLVLEAAGLHGFFASGTLDRLDQLRVLSLKANSLAGPVPDLSRLLNLKALFLGRNRFGGSFPASVLSLHRLRTLDLSNNHLSGPIPPALAALDRLYIIRLESNRFSGSIPPFNQTSLKNFNVSYNNFSGAVPMHKRAVVAIGFLAGSLLVIGIFGVSLVMQKRRRKTKQGEILSPVKHNNNGNNNNGGVEASPEPNVESYNDEIESGNNELIAAAALAMSEEKVKKLAKSGCLVFCAGEAQVYGLEQLMKASAEMLGRGSVGTTYKAVLDERQIVTVKRLDAAKLGATGKEAFEPHMDMVGRLRHPNLVPLRAYFQAKEERLLVYDYQPNGSLHSLIHAVRKGHNRIVVILLILHYLLAHKYYGKKSLTSWSAQCGRDPYRCLRGSRSTRPKPLHWTSCLKIAEDVAQGLAYVHQASRLVHGNIKSSNVLLGSEFEACLADNCLSFLVEPSESQDSSGYRAPETRKSNEQLTARSDIYAFGVLLLELLTGKPPLQEPLLMATDLPAWVRSTREDGADDERLMMIIDIAAACVQPSPDSRPTTWQVLKMIQEVKEADTGDNDSDSASLS